MDSIRLNRWLASSVIIFRQRDRMRVVDGERSISQLNRRTNRAVVEFLAGLIVVRQKEKFAVDERHR